ncbi:MFS transporter [Lignipirellula cremea]|uniref:Major facilitator superfamily transporter n=1 Tax=Lignipirellula cremea TaxID=2528010 RepID=A0A518DMD9_9BACT|nr:MFS transporter [Lignipirellula cremea]QDU93010.1 major facilitator superfamily transporter [Lignipirellula cremea]
MLKPITRPGRFPAERSPAVYDTPFWLTYAGNTCLMAAVSVLFRYSDFVRHVGGAERQLGLIVGVGAVGALAMRLIQGIGIDRFGPRAIWLLSLVGFIASCGLHLTIASAFGAPVFAAQILMKTSLAGAFGASIAFTSLRAPQGRMAEMIGMLGSSGFVGMAMGPVLGDYLFSLPGSEAGHVQSMFLSAIAAGMLSLLLATLATRGEVRPTPSRRPSSWKLVGRYHPGALLAVAVAMGLGLGLPSVFLRPFAQSVGIEKLRWFFLVYAATAFSVRIATRRWPEQLGLRPMILAGSAALAGSMLAFLCVSQPWMMVLPAMVIGTAHAFLFPTVMAAGSLSFPARYRGLATTVTLAMFDLGNLIGQPLVGEVIEGAKSFGLPPYPTMFVMVSSAIAVATIAYAVCPEPVRRSAGKPRPVLSAAVMKA